MFEQIKEYFQSIAATANKGKNLPVIVTVHGYGRRIIWCCGQKTMHC